MEVLFLLLGVGGSWLYFRKKVKRRVELDTATQKENEQIREENVNIKEANIQLLCLRTSYQHDVDTLIQTISDIEARTKELMQNEEQLKAQYQTEKEDFIALTSQKVGLLENIETLESRMEDLTSHAEEHFEQALLDMSKEFQISKEKYQYEYLQSMADMKVSLEQYIEKSQEELNDINAKIEDKKAIIAATVEANKRNEEQKNSTNFYRLILTPGDAAEIAKLEEILPYLRDKEALNKVIWKVYYEKPYTDLIGRVLGNESITGIYKITEIESNKCYVGQAVNVAERWRQHIKRGIGAETPTKNKLYPAMMSLGITNFMFELIEECPKDKLNEREDFWQDYFKAKEFGYSIK